MSVTTTYREVGEEARRNVPKVTRMLLAITGHTARELAQASEMSESKMSERLAGKTRISSDEIAMWAAYMEVDPNLFYLSPDQLRRAIIRPVNTGGDLRSQVIPWKQDQATEDTYDGFLDVVGL